MDVEPSVLVHEMDQAIRYSSQPYLWKNVTDALILIVIIVATTWFIKLMWDRRKLYYYAFKVHGPISFPLIGAMHKFAVGSTTSDILKTIQSIQTDHPGLSTFWFGPKLIYILSNPEHIEKICTNSNCLNKDALYDFISEVLGDGLMTSDAQTWKKNRKLIAPSFNQRILDNFVEIFENQAKILNDQIQKHVGEKDYDIFHLMSNCTLDIICETAMGVKMHAQTTECEFAKKADKMMEICALRIFHIVYHSDFIWKLFPLSKEYADARECFLGFCRNVIKKKLIAYQQKLSDQYSGLNADIEESGSKKIKAFLDLMLDCGAFSEQELNGEVNIFIIAGTDTTATALTAIFMCLGMNPDIQERVYQEVISLLGEDRNVVPSDLSKLTYMEMVIKETLRIFPVAPFFVRRLDEDVDVGETILPKGASAFFGIVHLHRDPAYWENPLKFDPDRFLPENVAKRHPCTYIPFSFGPRNCIGGRYAMMNMKTILCTVLRKYRFTSGYKSIEEVDMGSNITLRFTHGSKLTIHER